jgi:hypothetical protein
MTQKPNFDQIMKMSVSNQNLYWDIKDNLSAYTRNFIKESGLPFMTELQDKGEFVEPIIDLYNSLLILKD